MGILNIAAEVSSLTSKYGNRVTARNLKMAVGRVLRMIHDTMRTGVEVVAGVLSYSG